MSLSTQAEKQQHGVSTWRDRIRPCLCLVNRDKQNEPVCTRVDIASNAYRKAVGLLRRNKMDEDECLVIPQCSSIHTHFMRFDIDVLFVSETWEVLRVVPSLSPWRCVYEKGAAHVIEMMSGHARKCGVRKGTQLGLAIVSLLDTESGGPRDERG